eukprot:14841444-Heterocapsa_arctica.AAC.1
MAAAACACLSACRLAAASCARVGDTTSGLRATAPAGGCCPPGGGGGRGLSAGGCGPPMGGGARG